MIKKKVSATASPKVITLTPKQLTEIAANAAKAVGDELKTTFAGEMEELRHLVTGRDLQAAEEELLEIEGTETEDEEACDDATMTTKKVKAAKMKKEEDDDEEDDDDEDDDEMDAVEDHGIDEGDLEEMGPDPDEDENDEPGQFNKDAKNKGSKTTSEDKVGRNVNKAVTGSAEILKTLRRAVKVSRNLAAQVQELRSENAQLKKEFKKYKVQATKMSAETSRRSSEGTINAEVAGLLRKGGIDVQEFQASGQKFTSADVDALIQASGIECDVTKRMEIKNKIYKSGMMEDGVVDRGNMRGLI